MSPRTLPPAKDFTISFVMPNYNHGALIGEALKAVLSQSYRPLEVIVVDDGSKDNSLEVINQFIRKDPIVRLIDNVTNKGPVYTLDRGMKECKGEYVYGGGADDRILPGFFEKSIKMLRRYPTAGLCVSNPAVLDDKTGRITESPLLWSETSRYFSPAQICETIMGGYIPGISNICRRDAFEEVGGYGYPELRWASDWFLWQVVGMRYGICYIPEALAAQRVNVGSYSESGRRDPELQDRVVRYIVGLLRTPQFRDVVPAFIRGSLMSHYGDEGLQTIMKSPDLWDAESILLFQESLNKRSLDIRMAHELRRQKVERHQILSTRIKDIACEFKEGEALSHYSAIIKDAPDFLPGYFAISRAVANMGAFPTAIQVLEQAEKVFRDSIELKVELGNLYLKAGERQKLSSLIEVLVPPEGDIANYEEPVQNLVKAARAQLA